MTALFIIYMCLLVYVVFFAGLKYFEDMNLIFSNNAIQRLKKMHLIKDDEHIEAALNRFLDISFYLQNSNVSGDSESDQLLIAYADSSAWMNSALMMGSMLITLV